MLSVLRLYELLPVHFLSFETSSGPDSLYPYFVLAWSGKQTGKPQTEEIVLIPPGIRANLRNPVSFYHVISFYSSSLQNHELIKHLEEPFVSSSCSYVKKIIDNIPDLAHQPPSDHRQIELSNALFSLMAEILNKLASTNGITQPLRNIHPISEDGKSIIFATRYIRKNLDNPDLSLNDIAFATGYNPNYFCYKFSCILHVSPIRYLKTARLERTLQLLIDTDYSVQSVCRLVGIRNPSSLSSLVKAATGLTPTEYRMKNKQLKYNC